MTQKNGTRKNNPGQFTKEVKKTKDDAFFKGYDDGKKDSDERYRDALKTAFVDGKMLGVTESEIKHSLEIELLKRDGQVRSVFCILLGGIVSALVLSFFIK